jgi:hypothetical protein
MRSLKLGLSVSLRSSFPGMCPVPLQMYNTIQRYVRHHAVRTLRRCRAIALISLLGFRHYRNVADVAARHFYKRPLNRTMFNIAPATGGSAVSGAAP